MSTSYVSGRICGRPSARTGTSRSSPSLMGSRSCPLFQRGRRPVGGKVFQEAHRNETRPPPSPLDCAALRRLLLRCERLGRWPRVVEELHAVFIAKAEGGQRPILFFATLYRLWAKLRLPVARRWEARHDVNELLALNEGTQAEGLRAARRGGLIQVLRIHLPTCCWPRPGSWATR